MMQKNLWKILWKMCITLCSKFYTKKLCQYFEKQIGFDK